MKNTLYTLIMILLFLTGCNDTDESKKQDTKEVISQEKSVEKATKDIMEDSKNAIDNVLSTTKDEFNKVYENNKENINYVIEKTKEQSSKVIQSAQESVKELQQATENFTKEAGAAIDKTIQTSKEAFTSTNDNPNNENSTEEKESMENDVEKAKTNTKNIKKDSIFNETTQTPNPNNFQKMGVSKYYSVKCSGCHGQYADKKALNKSAIIKTWKEQDISNALQGYKDGTYGGNSKKTMYIYAKNLNNEEIEELAKYISNL